MVVGTVIGFECGLLMTIVVCCMFPFSDTRKRVISFLFELSEESNNYPHELGFILVLFLNVIAVPEISLKGDPIDVGSISAFTADNFVLETIALHFVSLQVGNKFSTTPVKLMHAALKLSG